MARAPQHRTQNALVPIKSPLMKNTTLKSWQVVHRCLTVCLHLTKQYGHRHASSVWGSSLLRHATRRTSDLRLYEHQETPDVGLSKNAEPDKSGFVEASVVLVPCQHGSKFVS